MTIQIKGLNETTLRLRVTKQRINYAIKESTVEAAEEIAEESEQNAPVLTGRLEGSHRINEVSPAPDVAIYTVTYNAINPKDGFDYGTLMHESYYNLGPESLKKQQSNGHIVGRKFLERAAQDTKELCIAIVRQATKEAVRESQRRR